MTINDNIKFLENKKQIFKRTICCRSQITTQAKNNSLGYMIYSTFTNISTLFVLSFKNYDDNPTRDSFDKYYMPLVEVQDFNIKIIINLLA